MVDICVAVCVAKLYLYFFDRRWGFLDNFEFDPDTADEDDTDKDVSSLELVLPALFFFVYFKEH